MSREFLVTKLTCTACLSNLNVSYKTPKISTHAQGQPTGAAMVEVAVGVDPCAKCFEPLNQMRRAFSDISKLAGGTAP